MPTKAERLPSGNWRVRVYVGMKQGNKKEYKTFVSREKETAEKEAASFEISLREMQEREQHRIDEIRLNPLCISIGEAMTQFIDNREFILSPGTIRSYRQIRRDRFSSLMDIKLYELKQEDITRAVNIDAQRLSPKTIRNAHALLSSVLAVYHSDFEVKTTLPGRVAYESEIPEDDVFLRMLEMSKGTCLFQAIVLAACLGLRRSELCALEWTDFDEKTMKVRINKALVRNDANEWVLKRKTKTVESTRKVSVSKKLYAFVMSLPRESERIIPVTPNAITDRFIRLRDKLGTNIRFHDLRHYNASVMLALNIPDKYAMKRGGWKTSHIMKSVYQHTFKSKQATVDDTINEHFDKLLDGVIKEEE